MCSRRVIASVFALVVVACALIAWRDTRMPVLHEVVVPVEGLGREVRVLHASDLHSSRFGEGQHRLAALLAGAGPFDAAVLTGDLVVRDAPDDVARALELASLALEHAEEVFFYPGNHDGPALASALAGIGIRDLADHDAGSRVGEVATDAGTVLVAPVWEAAGDGSADLVLLATHHPLAPGALDSFAGGRGRTTVVLAGHTHGGQVHLPLVGALVAPRPADPTDTSERRPGATDWFFPDLRGLHVTGLYGSEGTYQHVSAGLGTHAVPVRFGPRSSMTVLRFVPAPAR